MVDQKTALVVIDVQNDYFAQGALPLWNSDACLVHILHAIEQAKAQNIPVILVQHVASSASFLFQQDSVGAQLHSALRAVAADALVVTKTHADSFLETQLAAVLTALGVKTIRLCGMMTQNCVTHTALSPAAAAYSIEVLATACTTVSELLHELALKALAVRVQVVV